MSDAVLQFRISTFYVWHQTWSGTQPASNAPIATNTWMKLVRASYGTGRLTANGTMLGRSLARDFFHPPITLNRQFRHHHQHRRRRHRRRPLRFPFPMLAPVKPICTLSLLLRLVHIQHQLRFDLWKSPVALTGLTPVPPPRTPKASPYPTPLVGD